MRSTICGRTMHGDPAERDARRGATHGGAAAETSFSRPRGSAPPQTVGQDRHPPGRVEDEEPERRVGSGDQHVDRRVVEAPDPSRALRCPRAAVEEAADTEQQDDACSKGNRRRCRHRAVRRERKCDAKRNGRDEGELVRHAAQTGPGRAVAGRPAGKSYGRCIGVNLEPPIGTPSAVSRFEGRRATVVESPATCGEPVHSKLLGRSLARSGDG